jgi:hypothetical protein
MQAGLQFGNRRVAFGRLAVGHDSVGPADVSSKVVSCMLVGFRRFTKRLGDGQAHPPERLPVL